MRGNDVGSMPLLLMYHSVAPYEEDPYEVTISPSRFEQQMGWLAGRGFRGASVAELLDARAERRSDGLVGLTFDDGYADFLSYALPILRTFGFGATLFVVSEQIGGTNVWDPDGPTKPLLTARQLRQVADSGIEIGSHGHDHVRLTDIPPAALDEHLVRSRNALEDLTGTMVGGFCYPYGAVSQPVVDAVREAGYDYACTDWMSPHSDRYTLPRTYVHDGDHPLRMELKRARHFATAYTRRAQLPYRRTPDPVIIDEP